MALCVCIVIALWLAFQYKPGWYQPIEPNEDVLRRARRDAPNLADRISEHLVRGEPIEIALAQTTINEWLAALPHVWPDARRRIPDEITHPAVSFAPDQIRFGAHMERSGWRAIAAMTIHLSLTDDDKAVVVRLSRVQSGSLTLPRPLVAGWVDRQLDRLQSDNAAMHGEPPLTPTEESALPANRRPAPRTRQGTSPNGLHDVWRRIESADELFNGVRVPNRFIWPNGRREFRLGWVKVRDGELRIRLEPL